MELSLKLHLADSSSDNMVTGYGAHFVAVNGKSHFESLIVTPSQLIDAWGPEQFEDLHAAHMAPLVALKPAIVLLGTGSRLRFPATPVLRPLIEARVGFEVMDVWAACRTYNVLAQEGRSVAAALILR